MGLYQVFLVLVVGVTLSKSTLLKVISLSEGDSDDPVFTTSCKWNRELILKSPGDLEGLLVHSEPKDACTKVDPPPEPPSSNGSYPIEPDWILIATWDNEDRCTLLTKAALAEKAGYSAVVIQLGEDEDGWISWSGSGQGQSQPGSSGDWDYSLNIYPCLVSYEDGLRLWNNYTSDDYIIRFEDQSVDTWTKLFITTFLALIAILLAIALSYCVVQMFILLVVWIRDSILQMIETRRLNRRRRLSSSHLKRIPTQTWTPDIPQDMCTICLENYVEVDRVRILPCSHVFHMACIDPWLLNQRRKCPNCKRKIVFPDEPYDSDSSTEDERTPLIQRAGSLDHSIAGGLTFTFNESDFANQQQPIYRAIHRMMLEANQRQRAALDQRLRNQHLSRTQGQSQGQVEGHDPEQGPSSSLVPAPIINAANTAILQHAIRHHRLSRFCPRKRLPRSLFGGNNSHPGDEEGSGEGPSTNSSDGDYLEDTSTVGVRGQGHDNPNWGHDPDEFLQEGHRAYEDSLRQGQEGQSQGSHVRLALVEEEDGEIVLPANVSRIEGEVYEIPTETLPHGGADGRSDHH